MAVPKRKTSKARRDKRRSAVWKLDAPALCRCSNCGELTAPHKVCAYIYDLANAFNKFYHETKILGEEDEEKRAGFIALLVLTKRVLETCIDILGFDAPERM